MRLRTLQHVLKACLVYSGLLFVFEATWCVFNGCKGSYAEPFLYLLALGAFLIVTAIAVFLSYVVGYPLLRGLQRLGLEQPFEVCAVGALLGVAPFLVLHSTLWPRDFSFTQLLLFAAAGAIAGAVYVSDAYVVRIGNSEQA